MGGGDGSGVGVGVGACNGNYIVFKISYKNCEGGAQVWVKDLHVKKMRPLQF